MTSNSVNTVLKIEIKDTSIYFATTVITQLGNFLVIPLFWKEFSPIDYGVIAITEIIGVVLAAVLGLSLDQSITRFYYEWPEEEKRRRIGAVWVINWSSAIILGLISIALLYVINPVLFPEVEFFPIIFLGTVNAIFVSLTVVVLGTIRIKKAPKLYLGYRLLVFFLQIGITIYYVIILKKGLTGYFTALVIGSSIIVVISAFLMCKFGTPCIRNAAIADSLRFSLHIIPSSLISAVTAILDRFILKYYCSLEMLGIYSIALKFASLVSVVQSSLKLSYGPFFMKNIFKENGQEIIRKIAGFYIFPLFFSGLILSIFTDKIIYWINQPLYFAVIEYVPYLVIISIIGSLNVFYANGIILSNRTYLLTIPTLFQMGALLLGVFLIPMFNIYGIIIAKTLSVILFLSVSVYISNCVYKLTYNWKYLPIFGLLLISGIYLNVLFSASSVLINTMICVVITLLFLVISFLILIRDYKFSKQRN